MAYAAVCKFVEALMIGGEPDLPANESDALDLKTPTGQLASAAKKRNALAMASLTMAFLSEATLGLVFKAKTTAWPSGLAHLVVAALYKRYQPQDIITRVEMRQMLNGVRMKKGQDPATLFDQLSAIEYKYNTATKKIDEEDLIAVVLDSAPAEYQGLLTSEERMKGTALVLSDLETVMEQYWRQTKSARSKNGNNDSEFSLATFSGNCFRCGKPGHMSKDCPEKKSNNNGRKGQKVRKKCSNCGIIGHEDKDCFEKEENKHKRPARWKSRKSNEQVTAAIDGDGGSTMEFLLCSMEFPATAHLLDDPNVWIADTAATTHMSPHQVGMIGLRDADQDDGVTMGNKQVEKTMKVGDIPVTVCDKEGSELAKTMLQDVSMVPTSGYNLFSLTKMMKAGWTVIGKGDRLVIQKDGNEVAFDIAIKTPKGVLFAAYLKRTQEVAGAAADKQIRMTIAQAHAKLGHCSEDLTRKTAKLLGWDLIPGSMEPCEACAAGKAKQKNVPKMSKGEPAKGGKNRIYLDIASVKRKKEQPHPTKPNWRIMVDERTQLKFSDFFETKNGMVEPTCERLHKWKQAGYTVDYLRMDNAGENKLLKQRCESKDWKMNIDFEFTARNTPQQNSLAEVSLATIANRGRSLMSAANVPELIRNRVYSEAFKTATLLDGLVPIELDGKEASRYEHWCGKVPGFAEYLRTWGEAGTVTIKDKMMPKVRDRGVQCMFVGYALDHPGDTYRMWDPNTGRVHTSRDVTWLNRMYYQKPVAQTEISVMRFNEIDDDDKNEVEPLESLEAEEGSSIQGSDESESEEEAEAKNAPSTTRSGRAIRAAPRLITEAGYAASDYDIELTLPEQHYYAAMKDFPQGEYAPGEIACVGAGIGGGFANTMELHVMKYNQALAGSEASDWKIAVDVKRNTIACLSTRSFKK